MEKLFDIIVDGNDIKKSKPDPEVFEKAGKLLGCLPGKCLVCEDADAGVETGVNVGMSVMAVGYAKDNVKAAYHFMDLQDSIKVMF